MLLKSLFTATALNGIQHQSAACSTSPNCKREEGKKEVGLCFCVLLPLGELGGNQSSAVNGRCMWIPGSASSLRISSSCPKKTYGKAWWFWALSSSTHFQQPKQIHQYLYVSHSNVATNNHAGDYCGLHEVAQGVEKGTESIWWCILFGSALHWWHRVLGTLRSNQEWNGLLQMVKNLTYWSPQVKDVSPTSTPLCCSCCLLSGFTGIGPFYLFIFVSLWKMCWDFLGKK